MATSRASRRSDALLQLGRRLSDKRLLVVGGKGGVGRTVVSVALARLLAGQGQRVLLAHVRTRQRVSAMLGGVTVDEEIRPAGDNLWVVNMTPRAALRERGLLTLRFNVVYRAVMENRLVRHFLRAIPSLDEYSVLGKAWYHTTEEEDGVPRFDTVVFDGPATGHLLAMLRIPRVILDVVPEGPLTRDAVKIHELLLDPERCGLWIVSLAEEMPASEARDLYHAARDDLGMVAEALLINGLYPDELEREPELRPGLERLHGEATDLAVWPMARAAWVLDQRRQINRRYLDQLSGEIPLPQLRLPLLFSPELDLEAVEHLRRLLAAQLLSDRAGE